MRLRFLIASGPTQEPLDPVRYLSNNSTGVMGRHLVGEAKRRGHRVTHVESPRDARTARDLEKKLRALLPKHDVFIMASAVCDVRPALFSQVKIKKERLWTIPVVKNPDILAGLAKKRKKGQVFIGFGLESNRMKKKGYQKLKSKGLELIVLQRVTTNEAPFGEKPIQALVMDNHKQCREFKSISKKKLAGFLVQEAEKLSRLKIA